MAELEVARHGALAHAEINRPRAGNSFHPGLIDEIISFFELARQDKTVRVILLTASGRFFCTGADLEWMKQSAALPRSENIAQIRVLARMYDTIAACPVPFIGRVKGPVRGGGVGLMSMMDYCIAESGANFAMSETRWGLIPGVMMPYVVAKIGRARFVELATSGRTFTCDEAIRYGLLDSEAPVEACDEMIDAYINQVLQCAPEANRALKTNAYRSYYQPLAEANMIEPLIESLADLRQGEEAQHGLASFLTKNSPDWCR